MFSGTIHKAFLRSFCCLLGGLLFLTTGCAKAPVKATIPAPADKHPLKIAVMHFQRVLPEGKRQTVACPLTGAIFNSCNAPDGTEQILETTLLNRLRKPDGPQFIPTGETDKIYQRLPLNSLKTIPLQILKSIGEQSNADAILVGYLFCYRERVGYEYAAERPASVAFGVYLIRLNDGKMLWKGVFEKTQKSLFEDLFQLSRFIKEKGKWVTADALLKEGIDEVALTFPATH